jgi:catechol 2,3-dioxygenase-like lactoylglutathione lyase family enzyme
MPAVLESILMVTLLAADPAAVSGAWQRDLDYREVRTGRVDVVQALAWDAPAMAGRPWYLLQPASGESVFVRVIGAPAAAAAVEPFRQHGWNAVELLVRDPDALAKRLAGSSFEVIGPPADLLPTPDSPRAMQVVGPGGQVLYLTRILPAGVPYDLGQAATAVDRPFIAVVGGPDITQLRRFYRDVLGLPVSDPSPWRIAVLAAAHGLPAETTFPLAVAELPRRFLVELDGYPPQTRPRHRQAGYLPAGIAMVTFAVPAGGRPRAPTPGGGARLPGPPYDGAAVAVVTGPAGEWLELVEQRPRPAAPAE